MTSGWSPKVTTQLPETDEYIGRMCLLERRKRFDMLIALVTVFRDDLMHEQSRLICIKSSCDTAKHQPQSSHRRHVGACRSVLFLIWTADGPHYRAHAPSGRTTCSQLGHVLVHSYILNMTRAWRHKQFPFSGQLVHGSRSPTWVSKSCLG